MNECCRRRCCKRKRCFWQKVRPVKNPSRATSLRPIPSDACAMTAVLLTTAAPSAARVRVASSSGRHPAPCATSSRPSRFAAPRASPDVSPASFSRLAKRGGTTRTRASAGRPPHGGTGGERLGDDNMRRGPPGAERDPYRAADGYEYDYPPPRGGGRFQRLRVSVERTDWGRGPRRSSQRRRTERQQRRRQREQQRRWR